MALYINECVTCKARNCSILNGCGMSILNAINTSKHSRALEKGEKLFSEGEPIAGVYFIKKGFLRIELHDNLAKPLVIKFAGKGTIFGHVGVKENPIHPRTVTTVTKVQYCFIPMNTFEKISKKNPTLIWQINNQILQELKEAERKALAMAYKSVREKVAETLLALADIYDYEDRQRSFRINYSREDIADLIGSTKEQVSKVLKDFENEDLIRVTAKKFSFLDPESLRSIADNIPLADSLV